jgi:hypothetical protein
MEEKPSDFQRVGYIQDVLPISHENKRNVWRSFILSFVSAVRIRFIPLSFLLTPQSRATLASTPCYQSFYNISG